MAVDIEKLISLYSVDAEAYALEQLERRRQRACEGLREAREARVAEVDALEAELEAMRTEERRLSRDLHRSQDAIASADRALRTGTLDGASAIRQLESSEARADRLETEILESMELQEERQEQLQAAQHAREEASETLAELEGAPEVVARAARLGELSGRRRALLEELPLDVQGRYRTLRRSKSWAFTHLKDDGCVRCFTFLGQQTTIAVARGELLRCRRCGRWLLPEPR